jgi:pimeloyl-ACP methyl ester carboxylesterase
VGVAPLELARTASLNTARRILAVTIPFLLSVATEVLRVRQIEQPHLIGHSMGGLTALLLADQDRAGS